MAKIPFSKLKCKVNIDEATIQLGEQTVAVKQYLPIQDKLKLIGTVIEQAHMQDENYSNPVKANVFMVLEMVKYYTDITFTEKQLEDPSKLYDALKCSGYLDTIWLAIPIDERDAITIGLKNSIDAVYAYQNSIYGILDTLKTDYSNIDLDLSEMAKSVENPQVLSFVKNLVDKVN